jgi:branched-chain amino acid transport system substrate-binding protein
VNRKGFLLSGAAAATGSALPNIARAQMRSPYAQQVTIAVNAPLSGNGQSGGLQIANGVQAAVDEANRFGNTYSTAYAMRAFDDLDALAQAIVNVQFAAADATIVATIGGFDGQVIAATLPTYANQQMPVLVPGSTMDGITARGFRNVWRLPTKDSVEGQLHARFIAKRLKPKSVLAVSQDGDYGVDVARAFVDQAKSAGIGAADGFVFPYEKPEFTLAAKRIAEKQPEYILLCGTTGAMGGLIPALRGAGYTGKLGGSEGFYNEATLSTYAEAFAGGFISTSFPPLDRAPDAFNALTDFRARYNVTSLSAFAYAAAQIVISATKRTGATNRLAAMTALQTPASYDTIVGSFQFDVTGDPVDPNLYFYEIRDGKFKYVAPAHPSSFVL